MRHLFNRGHYKPVGVSGKALREAMVLLNPEIYGSIRDPQKVELDGLVYIIDRLPKGIEECRYVRLISEEGFVNSDFKKIIPTARRRNCYRIDEEQMFVEVTRGRSEIYDVLTHLTFMYNEAEKIRLNALNERGEPIREWLKLEELVQKEKHEELSAHELDVALSYLSILLARPFDEIKVAHQRLSVFPQRNNNLFHIVYYMGKLSLEEQSQRKAREISFSSLLRERIGRHIYGEIWALRIRAYLHEQEQMHRPLHIVSANLHSYQNALYAFAALPSELTDGRKLEEVARMLSQPENGEYRKLVEAYAREQGVVQLDEDTGTHISAQVFDLAKIPFQKLPPGLKFNQEYVEHEQPLMLVIDYAFGEQAFEVMDELLKPFPDEKEQELKLNIASISVMGKAGVLYGQKGDIMVPTAHVFEGTADNYPVENDFSCADFNEDDVSVYEGTMITVLGTSLQNRNILAYFRDSSWRAIGLEMEGAHYQKAIQAASRIRRSINTDVVVRYAYYASDNPLITGNTLASGSLGLVGVKPTYLITHKVLERVLNPQNELRPREDS